METSFDGCCILIVEDEYLLADDIRRALSGAGAEVCGPFATVASACRALDDAARIDCALLDVNLSGEMVFGLADMLVAREIPFAFTTGYDRDALPARFEGIPRLERPTRANSILNLVGSMARRSD